MFAAAVRVVGIDVQGPGPAPPEAKRFPSARGGLFHNGLDTDIKARNVAATGQNCNAHKGSRYRFGRKRSGAADADADADWQA
jgi:hypothetical protein